MKNFMFLHYGFEKPTQEIMAGWNAWFASVAEHMVGKAHFPVGREISDDGTRELPLACASSRLLTLTTA